MELKMLGCFVCVTFLALVNTGDALKCYFCVSGEDGCDDPFDKDGNGIEKRDQCDYCQKTKSQAHGGESIARICMSDSDMPKKGCEKSSVSDVTTTYCYCDHDLCNSSSIITSSITVLAFIASLTVTVL